MNKAVRGYQGSPESGIVAYTKPADKLAIVKEIIIANPTASVTKAGISIVQGSNLGTLLLNRILFDSNIQPDEVKLLKLNTPLNGVGDYVSVQNTAPGGLAYTISVLEEDVIPYLAKKMVYANMPSTVAATVYTVPAGKSFVLKELLAANVTALSADFRIHIVPSGGTATNNNVLLPKKTIPPNDLAIIPLSTVLNEGDFIAVSQTTTDAIALHISGAEVDYSML